VATIAITGSAGGIGAATRERLERDGHQVVGVDVRDAEVVADLSNPEGRAAMVEAVNAATGGVLDGLVAAAGLLGGDGPTVVAVNHFGAVATLDGLRPLLERGTSPSAVAISSNSTTTFPDLPMAVADACLAGDEVAARAAAEGTDPVAVYPATKLALARWVRQAAVSEAWAGSGIRLNAVAPGFIATPMTAGTEEFVLGLGDVYPVPQRRAGHAAEVAALLAFLLSPDAAFFCGSVVFMDGGTDAAVRPDRPDPRT
jgi:NAD(P)-dependent dehydrogenase (short-subunit alcohol dehydrogenase family)